MSKSKSIFLEISVIERFEETTLNRFHKKNGNNISVLASNKGQPTQKIPQTMLFRLRDFFVLFIGRLPGTEGAKPALQRRQRVKKASARVCGGEDGMV